MIRAVFLDIDGTLVSLKTASYPKSTVEAVAKLRENGILCFVATGRSIGEIARDKMLGEMEFDGYVLTNGQTVYDGSYKMLASNPIATEDCRTIFEWCQARNAPCWAIGSKGHCMNMIDKHVEDAMVHIHSDIPPVGDVFALLEGPIYMINLFRPRAEFATMLETQTRCIATEWFEYGYDVVPRNSGKVLGIQKILDLFHLEPQDCMAIGDSENDLGMLRMVGTPVAMGNATQEAKDCAVYITTDCDDDGIYNALRHFGLI